LLIIINNPWALPLILLSVVVSTNKDPEILKKFLRILAKSIRHLGGRRNMIWENLCYMPGIGKRN